MAEECTGASAAGRVELSVADGRVENRPAEGDPKGENKGFILNKKLYISLALWYNSIIKRQGTAVLAMEKKPSSTQADAAVFSQLQAENTALKKEVAELHRKLERMNELLLNAQRARFGQSSEKRSYVLPDSEQMRIFNEVEAVQDPKAPEPTEETVVKAHTRKPKRTVDELTEGLPDEKIILDLTEEEQVCGTCGSKLKRFGEKLVRGSAE